MTSFGYFGSGTVWTDPYMGVYDGTLQWYNLLRGYAPVADLNTPPRFVHTTGPLKNQPTKFPLDGNPVTQTGDVDGIEYQPGDRRILFCSGPFDMAPDDEQQIVVAMVGGLGSDHIKSVEELKNNVQIIRVKGALNPLSEKVITVTKFNLSQNYPNPFNPVTSIKFSIPYNNKVSLEVYNILGQKVCTLINKDLIRGEHIVEWNGRNDYGNQLGSGIYFYRIKTDHFIKSMKMILLK